jgi:hypothetical protein
MPVTFSLQYGSSYHRSSNRECSDETVQELIRSAVIAGPFLNSSLPQPLCRLDPDPPSGASPTLVKTRMANIKLITCPATGVNADEEVAVRLYKLSRNE